MNKTFSRLQPGDARSLLGKGLEGEPDFEDAVHDLDFLSSRLAEWPPMLQLINGFLRKTVEFEYRTVRDAILRANLALDKQGLIYFDVNRSEDRFDALSRTIEACMKWLSPEERELFFELAVFPADTDVRLNQVMEEWLKCREVDEREAQALCAKLMDLSLISGFNKLTIQINGSIHDYLKAVTRTLPVDLKGPGSAGILPACPKKK